MNNNIILELRQTDSKNVVENGDYEVELAKEVTINEGDIIQMKQSFIDVTNSDQIQIPYDLILSTEHILYYTDWIIDTGAKGQYFKADGSAGSQGQGNSFVPCDVVPNRPLVGYTTYTGANYICEDISPVITITYQYVDINNVTQIFASYVKVDNQHTDTFSVIAKTGTLIIAYPSVETLHKQYLVEFQGFDTASTPPTIDSYNPFLFTTSFRLPAGSYDAVDLSLFLSENLSKNNVSETQHSPTLINSPFLKSASQFDINQPYPNSNLPTPPTIANVPIWISTQNGQLAERMNFTAAAGYFIGASQIAMEYNTSTQKFNWTYVHFPMYDGDSGNQISVRYIKLSQGCMAVARNGGIAFTKLNAVVADTGVPFNFWDNVLGFNLDTLLAKPNYFTGKFAGLDGNLTYYNLIDGVNTTNGFVGIDSAVIKGVSTWYKEQPLTNFTATIDTTINIVAEKSLNETLNKFSHFLLSCSLQYTVDYVGSDNYFNIQGIVNKYMSYGAYVYSSSDGSIQYQHTGAPITLKRIGVRILKSDKTRDITLGKDNTVIFEIIKSNQQIVPKK